jgi:hypothetical protein
VRDRGPDKHRDATKNTGKKIALHHYFFPLAEGLQSKKQSLESRKRLAGSDRGVRQPLIQR